MIEWPMYIQKLLPDNAMKITIRHLSENERFFSVEYDDEKVLEMIK